MKTITVRFRESNGDIQFTVIAHEINEPAWTTLVPSREWRQSNDPQVQRSQLWSCLEESIYGPGVTTRADAHIKAFGERLFNFLFLGNGTRQFNRTYLTRSFSANLTKASPLACLIIEIPTELSPLHRLPWEALLEPQRGAFFHDRKIAVVRHLLEPSENPRQSGSRLRMFGAPAEVPKRLEFEIYASESMATGLSWSQEVELIGRFAQQLGCKPPSCHESLTAERTVHRGSSTPITHVVCHGRVDDYGMIRLQNKPERSRGLFRSPEPAEELLVSDVVGGFPHSSLLLFVNACHAGGQVNDRLVLGRYQAVQTLVSAQKRARFMILNSWSVADDQAVKFSEVFYDSLTQSTFLEAAWKAREAVRNLDNGRMDWLCPAIYVTDACDFRLSERAKSPAYRTRKKSPTETSSRNG